MNNKVATLSKDVNPPWFNQVTEEPATLVAHVHWSAGQRVTLSL